MLVCEIACLCLHVSNICPSCLTQTRNKNKLIQLCFECPFGYQENGKVIVVHDMQTKVCQSRIFL